MSQIALPSSVPVKRRIPWALAAAGALAITAVAWLGTRVASSGAAAETGGMFHTVVPIQMEVTVNKDGELQAVNNLDVNCPVEGQSVIQYIVKEGTNVKKGDVVVILDSSELQRKVEQAILDLQKAEADLTAAKETMEIQESTNVANLEAAEVELTLAKLDLQQYEEGTFPQLLSDAKRVAEMARITVKQAEQDLAQSQSLFAKGFVNAAEVKKGEIALLTAKNDLEKKETDLAVLEKYTYQMDLTSKKNAVVQAERKLVRVKRENASNTAQKVAAFNAAEQALRLRKTQHDNFKSQLENSTIKAPGDGLVLYGSSGPWSNRRDNPIQAGAQVRQQELLIRLPDTTSMKVVTKIQEAQAMKLRVDPENPMRATVKLTGVPEPVGGWVSNISVLADSGNRWWNPDNKEYPVDVTLDRTPSNLKPGVGAEVKIFVDRLNNVLAAPLASMYSAGPDSYVFVRDGKGTKPQKVALGAVNDTHAEIREGLKAGQDVLLLQPGQGRELLEKAGIKVQPATRPADVEGGPDAARRAGMNGGMPGGPGSAPGGGGGGQGMGGPGGQGGGDAAVAPGGEGGTNRRGPGEGRRRMGGGTSGQGLGGGQGGLGGPGGGTGRPDRGNGAGNPGGAAQTPTTAPAAGS